MTATFSTLRIGEKILVDADTLDQESRPGFITNQTWSIDEATIVAGDPTTPHGISSSSVANPTHITTSTAHGLVTGDRVTISGHSGSTPSINNSYTITRLSTTAFTIPVNVTVGGSGGTATRANADVAEVLQGPPPTKYAATLIGRASGSGQLRLTYADAFLHAGTSSQAITVLNASTFIFSGLNIVDGVLLLDFQDGTGPGTIDVTATPADSRGDEAGAPTYTVSSYQWTDAAGNLSLTNSTTATVSVEGADQGDGSLTVQAVNSAGVTITATLPYRVISTVSVTLAADA